MVTEYHIINIICTGLQAVEAYVIRYFNEFIHFYVIRYNRQPKYIPATWILTRSARSVLDLYFITMISKEWNIWNVSLY